jgi:hypothetical protein
MNVVQYTLLAYVAGLGLLGGYALVLWLAHRAMSKRERKAGAL